MRISELVEKDNGAPTWNIISDSTSGSCENSPYPEEQAFTPVDGEFANNPDQYSETGRRRVSHRRFDISNIDIHPQDGFWTRRPGGYNCVSGGMDNVRSVSSQEIFGVSSSCHSGMPGFCYLLAFRQEYRHDAAYALGSKPPLHWLLNLPYHWFVPRNELMRLVVSGNSNQLHVTHGVGTQLVMLMVALTKVYDPVHGDHMSMWYELRRYGLTRSHYVDQCLSTLSYGVTVGGFSSLTEFLAFELGQLGLDWGVIEDPAFRTGVRIILGYNSFNDTSTQNSFVVYKECGEAALSYHIARMCALERVPTQRRTQFVGSALYRRSLSNTFERLFDGSWFMFQCVQVTEQYSVLLAVLGFIDIYAGVATAGRIVPRWCLLDEVRAELLQT